MYALGHPTGAAGPACGRHHFYQPGGAGTSGGPGGADL